MNRKYMIFGIVAFFALALVTAGLVINWFSQTSEFKVTSPISVIGETTTLLQEVTAGESSTRESFIINNDGSIEVNVNLVDDAIEGEITTSYHGILELSSKDISTWALTEDKKATINYTIVGDSFSYEVIDSNIDLSGYTLIYYKDNEFNSNDLDRLTTIGSNEGFTTSFPHADDWNIGEEANYCDNGFDNYNACKGAKLWLVKTSDIVGGDLTWLEMANYLYETDLIQYNSEGLLVMYPGMSLEVTPEYYFEVSLESGIYTVTTQINPTA